MFVHADSEDSNQTGQMLRLICESLLDVQVILLVLSSGGSYVHGCHIGHVT